MTDPKATVKETAKESARKPGAYDPVRGAVVIALAAYDKKGVSFEAAQSQALSLLEMDSRDRRFFKRLLNGATKMRRRLDYQLRFYLARPSEKLAGKLHNILRLGLYQLQFVDRVPPSAVVDESVKLARYFFGDAKARMVNAVLRAYLRDPNKAVFADSGEEPVKYLADSHSYPDYFVEHCLKEFGFAGAARLLTVMNQPPALTIRVNLLKAKAPEVEAALTEAGVTFKKGEYLEEFYTLDEASIEQIRPLLDEGMIYVQDQSAGIAVRLLNPRPGMTMLDLTAAPGGKTTYAASRMRNKGRITAVDKSRKRLEMLVENCERMKVKIVSPVVADAVQFTSDEPFDRVLVDPPCSGWGTAEHHPELRWEKSEQDIAQMNKIQRKLLEKGAEMTKPGGILVYSTCTIMRAENDQIVEEFLVRHKNFTLESAEELFDKSLVSERGFIKTYPAMERLDGAFSARIKRNPN